MYIRYSWQNLPLKSIVMLHLVYCIDHVQGYCMLLSFILGYFTYWHIRTFSIEMQVLAGFRNVKIVC